MRNALILLFFSRSRIREIFFSFFFVLIAPNTLEAQDYFTINELSFACESCRFLDDSNCERTVGISAKLYHCDELFTQLLKEASVDQDLLASTEVEIVRALNKPELKIEALKILLNILAVRANGAELLRKNASELVAVHRVNLVELLDSAQLKEQVALAFWKGAAFDDAKESQQIKAAILSALPKINERTIAAELSVILPAKDLQFLNAVADRRVELSDAIGYLRDAIQACSQLPISADVLSTCLQIADSSDYRVFADHIDKLGVQLAIELGEQGQIKPLEYLEMVSKTKYRIVGTPRLNKILSSKISELQPGKLDLNSPTGEMIEFLSSKDPSLKLAKEQAFAVDKTTEGQERRPLSNGVILFALGVALISIFAIFRRQRRNAYRHPDPSFGDELSSLERQELRELMSYFGLPGFSEPQELTSKFRQEARRIHPDTGEDDPAAFTRLKSKYERAKTLLEKRRA